MLSPASALTAAVMSAHTTYLNQLFMSHASHEHKDKDACLKTSHAIMYLMLLAQATMQLARAYLEGERACWSQVSETLLIDEIAGKK